MSSLLKGDWLLSGGGGGAGCYYRDLPASGHNYLTFRGVAFDVPRMSRSFSPLILLR